MALFFLPADGLARFLVHKERSGLLRDQTPGALNTQETDFLVPFAISSLNL